MILALAFIKIEDSNKANNLLSDELPDDVLSILDWFKEHYIGRVIKYRRRTARFLPEIWKVHECEVNNEDSIY